MSAIGLSNFELCFATYSVLTLGTCFLSETCSRIGQALGIRRNREEEAFAMMRRSELHNEVVYKLDTRKLLKVIASHKMQQKVASVVLMQMRYQ